MKQFADAANEYGDVITSSPGPIPAVTHEQVQAGGAGRDRRRVRRADPRGEQLLEAVDRRPEREPARAAAPRHELFLALVDVRPRQRDRRLRRRCFTLAARAGRVLEPVAPSARCARARCRGTPAGSRASPGRVGPIEVVVDLAHRRHLGGGAAHEDLVGQVEVGADQRLLDDLGGRGSCAIWMIESRVIPCRIDGLEQVRRVEDAVLDDEDVLARAVGDVALLR